MDSGPNHCPTCDSKKKYSAKHDAYYCEPCDEWLEKNCGDEECEFCAGRPEKPSLVIIEDNQL